MSEAPLWSPHPQTPVAAPTTLPNEVLARSAAERYVGSLLSTCDEIADFFRGDDGLGKKPAKLLKDGAQSEAQLRQEQRPQAQQQQQQQQQAERSQQQHEQQPLQPQQPLQGKHPLRRPHSFHQQCQHQPLPQEQQEQHQQLQQQQQHRHHQQKLPASEHLPCHQRGVAPDYSTDLGQPSLYIIPQVPKTMHIPSSEGPQQANFPTKPPKAAVDLAWESSFFPPEFPSRQPTRQRPRPTPGMAQTMLPWQPQEPRSESYNEPSSSPSADDPNSTAIVPLRPPATSSTSSGTINSKKAQLVPTLSLGTTIATEPPSPSTHSMRSRAAAKPWLHNAKLPGSNRTGSKASERERFLPSPLTPNPFLDALAKLSGPDGYGGQEDGRSDTGPGRGGKPRRSLKGKGFPKQKSLQKAKTECAGMGATITSLGSTPTRPALFASMTKARSRVRSSITDGSGSWRPRPPHLGSSTNSLSDHGRRPRRAALQPSEEGEKKLHDYLQQHCPERLRRSEPDLSEAGPPAGENDQTDDSDAGCETEWNSQVDPVQAPTPASPQGAPTAPSPDSVFSIPRPPPRKGKGGFHRSFATKESHAGSQRQDEEQDRTIDHRLARRVQGRFRLAQTQQDGVREAEFTANNWEIVRMSRKLGLNLADVIVMKEIFDSFDTDGSGHLELHEFEAVVTKILEYQLKDAGLAAERAKCASQWRWWDGDVDDAGSLTFAQFVKWYTSNGFKEDLLLSPEEQWLRSLAKKYSLSATYVDQIKRCFDTYDTDKSGEVDVDEFEQILNKVLRIPIGMRLPRSRIMYFWTEIDCDQSGTAPFEEFLLWWMRHFPVQGDRNDSLHAVTEFYRNVRRIGPAFVDPPAYQGWKDVNPAPDATPLPSDRPRSKTVEIASEGREMVYNSGSSLTEEYSDGYYGDEYYDDYEESSYGEDFGDDTEGPNGTPPGILVREVLSRSNR